MTLTEEAVPRARPVARRPMNDTQPPSRQPEVTAPDRYAKEVELGLQKFMDTCAERDRLKRELEAEVLKNKQLQIDLDNARETERLHVQTLVQEALTAQSKAEAEAEVLRGEIASLRHETASARARAGRYEAFVDIVRSGIDSTFGPRSDEPAAATVAT